MVASFYTRYYIAESSTEGQTIASSYRGNPEEMKKFCMQDRYVLDERTFNKVQY